MDPVIYFPYVVLLIYLSIVLLFLWLVWRIALSLEETQRAADRIASALERRESDAPPG